MRLTIEERPETIKRYSHITPARGWRIRPCSAKCPGAPRSCTLERGHRGPHVAHGRFKRVVAVWDSGAGPERSGVMGRTSTGKSPIGLRTNSSVGVLERVWRVVVRSLAAPEDLALFLLFLAFVWFAFEWLLLIIG